MFCAPAIAKGKGLVAGGSVAGSPGVKERTVITCIADVGGSLHGKSFTIFDSFGQRTVTMNCGVRAEISSFDFTGLTGVDFVTGGAGRSVTLFGIHFFFGEVACTPWFNTGTEAPSGGPNPIEVLFGALDDADALASAFASAISAFVLGTSNAWSAVSTGPVATVTDLNPGIRQDASDVDSGVSVTIIKTGRDPVSGVDLVATLDNASADEVAAAIVVAFNGGAWLVAALSEVVTFTDSLAGARTDAADVDTGFGVVIDTQGVDPA